MSGSAQDFAKAVGASPDMVALYEYWFDALAQWNAKINLVSPNTLGAFWHRHALDSAQLARYVPKDARSLLDMGAGAGFPGLALAIDAKSQERDLHISLCEANGKKANFLRAVIRGLDLTANVAQCRVEDLASPEQGGEGEAVSVPYDVITARAFAPLPKLLDYASKFWGARTLGLFPKGRGWRDEVDAALLRFEFDLSSQDSETEEGAKILLITALKRK